MNRKVASRATPAAVSTPTQQAEPDVEPSADPVKDVSPLKAGLSIFESNSRKSGGGGGGVGVGGAQKFVIPPSSSDKPVRNFSIKAKSVSTPAAVQQPSSSASVSRTGGGGARGGAAPPKALPSVDESDDDWDEGEEVAVSDEVNIRIWLFVWLDEE